MAALGTILGLSSIIVFLWAVVGLFVPQKVKLKGRGQAVGLWVVSSIMFCISGTLRLPEQLQEQETAESQRVTKVEELKAAGEAACAANPACLEARAAAETNAAGSDAQGCQPHIEVSDAAWWAEELGQSEMWVLHNYRLNLWEHGAGSASNRGSVVGKLLVGSRAVVLDETADAYRVRSPLDESVGWISAIQVSRVIRQDVETREPCE